MESIRNPEMSVATIRAVPGNLKAASALLSGTTTVVG